MGLSARGRQGGLRDDFVCVIVVDGALVPAPRDDEEGRALKEDDFRRGADLAERVEVRRDLRGVGNKRMNDRRPCLFFRNPCQRAIL